MIVGGGGREGVGQDLLTEGKKETTSEMLPHKFGKHSTVIKECFKIVSGMIR